MEPIKPRQVANQQGYFQKIGFGHHPALFISDLQNAYTDPQYIRCIEVTSEIKIINKLIQYCRIKAIPIFFSVIAFDEYDIAQPNLWMQKIKGLSDLKAGTHAVDLNNTLDYNQQSDKLIIKQYPSAFFSTSLASLLSTKSIDTLIITGCSTSGCVRETAIDCMQHGFIPVVVEDAVADRWPESHKQALYEMSAKYADVINSKKALEFLSNYAKKKI